MAQYKVGDQIIKIGLPIPFEITAVGKDDNGNPVYTCKMWPIDPINGGSYFLWENEVTLYNVGIFTFSSAFHYRRK